MTKLLVVLSHPDTLASGRPIAPGDEIPPDALNPADAHDARLLVEGAFIARDDQEKPIDLPADLAAKAQETMRAVEQRHVEEMAATAAQEAAEWPHDPDNPDYQEPDTGSRLGDAPTRSDTPQAPVEKATGDDSDREEEK